MKKKLSLLAAFAIGAIALPSVVEAQASFSFDCSTPLENTTLQAPQTTCTLNVTPDTSEGAISNIRVQMIPANMTLGQFTTNSSIWSSDLAKDSNGFISFTNTTNAAFTTTTAIGTVDATLKETAHECGKICVAVAYTVDGKEVTANSVQGASAAGECKIQSTPSSPETGDGTTMASYIILAGGAVVAIAAISYARKSTKFYRV
ncbi:MAG: hypothetical protein ACI31M_04215 [Bacilli bacterium]